MKASKIIENTKLSNFFWNDLFWLFVGRKHKKSQVTRIRGDIGELTWLQRPVRGTQGASGTCGATRWLWSAGQGVLCIPGIAEYEWNRSGPFILFSPCLGERPLLPACLPLSPSLEYTHCLLVPGTDSALEGRDKNSPLRVLSFKEFKSRWGLKYIHECLQYDAPHVITGEWAGKWGLCGHGSRDISCVKALLLMINLIPQAFPSVVYPRPHEWVSHAIPSGLSYTHLAWSMWML